MSISAAIEKRESGRESVGEVLERVVISGDLSRLTPADRITYYAQVCRSLGLNPLTKPFEYISFRNALKLYATHECTDQLRKLHGIAIVKMDHHLAENGIYIVTASARDKQGRTDFATGVVALGGLRGQDLADAMMKAETKAKRRVTLSICGLGLMDDEVGAVIVPSEPVAELATNGEGTTTPPPAVDVMDETAERAKLIARATTLMNALKLKQDERQQAFKTYLGDATPEQTNVDLAALQGLVTWLESRAANAGLLL